jgi:hypothetical protein
MFRLLCGLGVLTKNGVLDAAAFVFDAVHEAARPNKFSRKQAQPEENNEPTGAWRDEHNDANEKQCETGDNAKGAANLVERGLEHDGSTNRLFEDGRSGDERQAGAIPIDLRGAWN